ASCGQGFGNRGRRFQSLLDTRGAIALGTDASNADAGCLDLAAIHRQARGHSNHGKSGCMFFFQEEAGIRVWSVTGVQTCALPISPAACIDRRQHLRLRGYLPIPLYGKAPVLKEWQKLTVISHDMIELWAKVWPDAHNTGALTRWMPTLDLDITCEPATIAIEDLVREHFSEHGDVLVRIGNPPKRAIPFRTNTPFKKITTNLIAPNGNAEKIEFLGDGQQIVVDGIHPETRRPYTWFGGVPWNVPHTELPYIHPHEAAEWVDKA